MKQKNKKRFLLIAALILMLALLLTACKTQEIGDGGENPGVSNAPSSTGTENPGENEESVPSQPGGSEEIPTQPGGSEEIPTQPGGSEELPTQPSGNEEMPTQPVEDEGGNEPTSPDGGWIDENEED